MLIVEHISKNYGPVRALQDVSIEVRPNEVVGLIGENRALGNRRSCVCWRALSARIAGAS